MINLFDNISNRNKQKLLSIIEAETRFYKKNVTIMSNVKPKNFIIYVETGYLEIKKTDYNGNIVMIDEIEENMLFGNMVSRVSSNDYEIIAKEDSEIIIIDFDLAINANLNTPYYHTFIKNLLLLMNEKISRSNKRIEVLTNKTIRNKLLEYFKLMSKENNSMVIYLPFTFNTLAEYLAVDRCAMSRELKNMKEEGIIEIKGKKIKLLYYIN